MKTQTYGRRKKMIFVLACVFGMMLISSPAQAVPVTYEFSGVVSGMDWGGSSPQFIYDNDRFYGTLSYDADLATLSNPVVGQYSAYYSLSVGFDNGTFLGNRDYPSYNHDDAYVSNTATGDSVQFVQENAMTSFERDGYDYYPDDLYLGFSDSTGTALDTDDSFPASLTAEDWDSIVFGAILLVTDLLDPSIQHDVQFHGIIDYFGDIDNMPVPEPATLLLLGSGLLGLTTFGRKKVRRRKQ